MAETDDTVDASETHDLAELPAGTEVGGYVIDGAIGRGGMGVVYGARQPRIGKRVAIKVLSPTYSSNPTTVRRFEQEAQVVNEIKHPNIVDVFQFGELPDGRSFFVMEWLDGEPLSARIERGPLPAQETMAILDVICDALEAAHEKGVIHRDLKSDNIFIVRGRGSRTVKLLDFGLAKLAGKNDLSSINRTKSGVLVGTPAYMAPEQARGKAVDARTDVYALGVLAFKMLTGVLPYKAENAMDLIVLHLNAPVPAPHKLAKETPLELSKLVQRMMAKDPAERPSLAEIRKLFTTLRAGRASVADAAPPPRRIATSVLIGLAMFLAGVIAVGAIWLVQRNKKHDAAATTEPAGTGSAVQGSAAPIAGSAAADGSATGSDGAQIGGPVPGSAIAIEPPAETIEFEEDRVGAAKSGSSASTRRHRADAGVEEEPAFTVPSNRPGSLILVLATASTIEIDGTAVAQSSKGGRFEVKPGSHEIRVKAPGRQPVVRTFEVEAGGTAVLRVADDEGGEAPAPAPAP